MSPDAAAPGDARLRARIETAHAGIALTFLEGVGLFGYVALTWSQPHRTTGALLAGMACLFALGLWLAPLERLLNDRWAPVTWLCWSGSLIVATAIGVTVDGSSRSPLVVVFVLMLMFAAFSYPRRIAFAVCVLDVAACLVALEVSGSSPAYTMLVSLTLAGAALLCMWQVNRQERQERALAALSRTDPLTGCLNRRAFDEHLAAMLAEHGRHGTPFGLILLDLDGFKAVNDQLGHAAGDALLQWTARTALACVRPVDVFARLGGDEFGVLVPGAAPEATQRTAGRLVLALAGRTPATAGAASCPADATDGDALYRHADARLYAAKPRPAAGVAHEAPRAA